MPPKRSRAKAKASTAPEEDTEVPPKPSKRPRTKKDAPQPDPVVEEAPLAQTADLQQAQAPLTSTVHPVDSPSLVENSTLAQEKPEDNAPRMDDEMATTNVEQVADPDADPDLEPEPGYAEVKAPQRAADLYLDTVNRAVLDFDFEKVCSVSLSNINVYGCLVCGKYFQGRSKKSPAYSHSIHDDHHVFMNLETTQVSLALGLLSLQTIKTLSSGLRAAGWICSFGPILKRYCSCLSTPVHFRRCQILLHCQTIVRSQFSSLLAWLYWNQQHQGQRLHECDNSSSITCSFTSKPLASPETHNHYQIETGTRVASTVWSVSEETLEPWFIQSSSITSRILTGGDTSEQWTIQNHQTS